MKKYKRVLVVNVLVIFVFSPAFAAFKLHSIQKYGDLSLFEYYVVAWQKLGLFFILFFICGCIVCGLIEKLLEKYKKRKNII